MFALLHSYMNNYSENLPESVDYVDICWRRRRSFGKWTRLCQTSQLHYAAVAHKNRLKVRYYDRVELPNVSVIAFLTDKSSAMFCRNSFYSLPESRWMKTAENW